MRTITFGGCGALAATLALLSFPGEPVHAAASYPIDHKPTAAHSGFGMAAPHLLLRFVPGHRLLYAVEMNNQAQMDMRTVLQRQDPNADSSAAPMMALNTSLRGDIEVVQISKTQAICSIRPDKLDIQANGHDIMEQMPQLRWELSQSILVQFTENGRIASVRFDPKCSTTAQGFARTLLAYLQMSAAPNSGEEKAWEAREEEPNGVFIATYTPQSHSNGDITLCKTKRATASSVIAGATHRIRAAKTVTPSGGLTITFDRDRSITKAVRGEEVFSTALGTVPVAQSHNAVQLHLRNQSLVDAAQMKSLLQLARARQQTRSFSLAQETEITPQQEAQIQRVNLGGATWDDLQRHLAALDRSTTADKSAQVLLPRLKAYIYLYPEVCPALQTMLLSPRTEGIKLALIVEALRATGLPQAQQTLIAVMHSRRKDERVMVLLLSTLGQLDAPIPQVETALFEQSFGNADSFISSTACLALGIVTHTLAQSAPDRSKKIMRALEQRLKQSHSAEQKETLLLALANAAQPSALPVLLRQAQDASPRVRGSALLALGRLPSEQADRKICAALALDADVRVRLAAAKAARGRLKSALIRRGMLQVLQRDKDAQVRLTALNTLWSEARQMPQVSASVQAVAQRDASKDIRKAATLLLAQQ